LGASVGIIKTLEAIEPYYRGAKAQWKAEPISKPFKRGIGIGSMWYGIGNTGVQNPSSARVEMDAQGKVTLFSGAADIGQGSSDRARSNHGRGARHRAFGDFTSHCRYGVHHERGELHQRAGQTTFWERGQGSRRQTRRTCCSPRRWMFSRLQSPCSSLEDGFAVDSRHSGPEGPLVPNSPREPIAKGRPLTWQGYFDPETTPSMGRPARAPLMRPMLSASTLLWSR